jgi:ribosome-associated toxin RatA of RatAB toxin-antitoxin module
MVRVTVTATESIWVKRSPEQVFDYTQDYATRRDWDPTVMSARVLSEEPRRVEAVMQGIGPLVIEYKLFRRGERTTAAFRDVDSTLISGGGGSWSYVARDGGTDWSQTATLEFRHRLVGWLMAPLLRRNMRTLMRKAMAEAKRIMETIPPA